MKPRDVPMYLVEIVDAARGVEEFCAGKSFADYQTDKMLRLAVERQFEIIGEALSQTLEHNPWLESKITQTRRIVGFRSRLIRRSRCGHRISSNPTLSQRLMLRAASGPCALNPTTGGSRSMC